MPPARSLFWVIAIALECASLNRYLNSDHSWGEAQELIVEKGECHGERKSLLLFGIVRSIYNT